MTVRSPPDPTPTSAGARAATLKPTRANAINVARAALSRPLYTLGHSTRTFDEFLDILRAFGITRVVDIRKMPRSKAHPQFDTDALRDALGVAGVAYEHLAALGGLRAKSRSIDETTNAGWKNRSFHNYADHALTPEFRAGLQTLLETAAAETCAILCSEAVWWRCHRRIVADHALAQGVPVFHLLAAHKSAPATMPPFARVGEGGVVTYPAD